MSNIHPIFVHFPIALLTVAFLFDSLAAILRKEDLERTGWWTLLAGSVGLAASVVSGLKAEESVRISADVAGLLERHEQLAFFVAAVFGAILLWRTGTRTALPVRFRKAYFVLYLVGLGMLWLGAWYGGLMVYTHGLGVGGE